MARIQRVQILVLFLVVFVEICYGAATDIELDAKAQLLHRIDSLNLLIYTFLLSLTVLTIWLFKHRRFRYLHETGLAVIYGLIIGAIIRYTGSTNSVTHLSVVPQNESKYNLTLPPDTLWLKFAPVNATTAPKVYGYLFRGEIVGGVKNNEIDLKATFDPEIFFNIILPPIIFHAGYSLKRRHFFRNLGAILTYALIGTAISSFVVGGLMYGLVQFMPDLRSSFTFLDTLYFGALISSTDPLTVLAIFHDLQVDVNLYALIFGESVLNDAVSIVLSGAIQNYGKKYQSGGGHEFETYAFFMAVWDFIGIFSLSLTIGAIMGCLTALLTKFTRVRDFPLLESALFLLMSYSTFLIAEVSDLTGVVAVLFCGICQAHYTYNNLSNVSRTRTKHLFELLNFLAENFIFCYIGVSMFTFPKHKFDPFFIFAGFTCALIGRAANIYPLSFLLNLGRKPKIPRNFQHMLFCVGLRGAMSFALAIRNTVSDARQAMLTTTSLIVILTVIIQGGATMQLLTWFKIPTGIREELEALPGTEMQQEGASAEPPQRNEKAFLARLWGDLDTRYMKPLLTDSRPTLRETLPNWCGPLANLLTTTTQMTQQDVGRRSRHDSDTELYLEDENNLRPGSHTDSLATVPRCFAGRRSRRTADMTSLSPKVFFKLVFIIGLLWPQHILVLSSDVDDDSLEDALQAIERRQRDLQFRENYGQPENIGYGFQKNLGFFEPGPSRHLGLTREPDEFDYGSSYASGLHDKRARSIFRERSGVPDNNADYLQALRQLWERYQHQRGPATALDLEDLSDQEVAELLGALEEADNSPLQSRGHRNYRIFDGYESTKRSPAFGQGLYGKRSTQRITHEQPPGDAFLYSLKWVNPGMNREAIEGLRGSESYDDERDSDVAALLGQPRYEEEETWLPSAQLRDLDYGSEPHAMKRFRAHDRKRAPVKRNANHAQKQTSDEVKGIFTTEKKKIGNDKKVKAEKKVVRRAEPSKPGEIRDLFRVQKKSIDWSKHFGVNKRMYANPFDTRVFNTKKNLADNLDAVENRIGGVEDRILEDAVKLTGARGDEGLDAIRDSVLRRLEAAYSLEKMRAALEDFKNSVSSVNTESPPLSSTVNGAVINVDDSDKNKRVAIKKEGVGDNLEFLNWQGSASDSTNGECPLLELLVDNCVRMEEALGKFSDLLTPACTLHQICYTCGPEFGFSRQAACDLMFLTEAQHLCQGKPECDGGAREAVLALRETHERSPPVGTCRANPCVAEHFLTSPSGVVSLNIV